jgi:predicted metal-dependent hydrolase
MPTTNSHSKDTWPPSYTIRLSKKAKYITLKITQETGLEVIIPSFRKRFNIPELLEERKKWIKKNLAIIQQAIKQPAKQQLPKILPINAAQEIWHIIYVEEQNNNIKLIEKKPYLVLKGKITRNAIKTILIKWLKQYAKKFFTAKLRILSNKTTLTYQHLNIRGQQTLWGSCNTRHNISLNFKLLFLPAALANYVLLHELCHTKYLNHSDNYWRLLEQYDNNYMHHDQELKIGDQYVPRWIL